MSKSTISKLTERVADAEKSLEAVRDLNHTNAARLAEANSKLSEITRQRDSLLQEVKSAYAVINSIQLSLEQFKTSYNALSKTIRFKW